MNVLVLLSVLFSAIPFVLGIYFRNRLKTYWPILIFVFFAFMMDGLSYLLAHFAVGNSDVFNLYTVIEFILLSLFFIIFFKNKFFSIISITLIVVFIGISFLEFISKGLGSLGYYTFSIEAIIMVAYAFSLFLFIMRNTITDDLVNETFFWINCGILIYFSGNILLFLLGKFLTVQQTFELWGPIHNILNIVFNILVSIGFLKSKYLWKLQ